MAPTLIYFPLPGRAEVARLLLSIGKVEFVVSAGSVLLTSPASHNL